MWVVSVPDKTRSIEFGGYGSSDSQKLIVGHSAGFGVIVGLYVHWSADPSVVVERGLKGDYPRKTTHEGCHEGENMIHV
jgi:hypothetical protein